MSVSSITQPQMMRLLYACTKPFLYYHEMIQITINSFVCIRHLILFYFWNFFVFSQTFSIQVDLLNELTTSAIRICSLYYDS